MRSNICVDKYERMKCSVTLVSECLCVCSRELQWPVRLSVVCLSVSGSAAVSGLWHHAEAPQGLCAGGLCASVVCVVQWLLLVLWPRGESRQSAAGFHRGEVQHYRVWDPAGTESESSTLSSFITCVLLVWVKTSCLLNKCRNLLLDFHCYDWKVIIKNKYLKLKLFLLMYFLSQFDMQRQL